jgi:hypothetical protein
MLEDVRGIVKEKVEVWRAGQEKRMANSFEAYGDAR